MPTLKATAGGIDIEDGEYEATLLSIEERAATPNSPSDKPFLVWTFTVYETDEGIEMAQATSTNFGPKANARKWAQNLEGREFDAGEDFDLDTLSLRDCRVVIEHNERGFARIVNVLAQRKRQTGKRQGAPDSVTV